MPFSANQNWKCPKYQLDLLKTGLAFGGNWTKACFLCSCNVKHVAITKVGYIICVYIFIDISTDSKVTRCHLPSRVSFCWSSASWIAVSPGWLITES